MDNVPSDRTPKDGFIRHANLGYQYDASSWNSQEMTSIRAHPMLHISRKPWAWT
jgi:hypothetical protein